MGEFELISTYFSPLAGTEGLGLLDDAACFTPDTGFDVVITKDTMVEGVHFPVREQMKQTAQRLMRVNLSDLSAKGAEPKGYLLSMAWPKRLRPEELEVGAESFAAGLSEDQSLFSFKLFGGDTVSIDGPMVVSATFLGQVPAGQMIKRSGARSGDDIWVTGTLGDSYLGLKSLQRVDVAPAKMSPRDQYWQQRYWRPEPRLGFGVALRKYATSGADISDGIFADAGNIAKASGVHMSMDFDSLPFSKQSLAWLKAQTLDKRIDLLTFGDDYELIFTADPAHRNAIAEISQSTGVRAARVGRCDAGHGVTCIDGKGKALELKTQGYRHF